jgi:alpha-mannosidase
VVWNPNTFDVDTAVEAEFQWAWEFPWYGGPLTVLDHTGKVIPCQIIQETCGLPRFRSRLVFRDTVPSVGYKLYYVRKEEQPDELSQRMNATPEVVENRRYKVTIDKEQGCIASVYDKKLGRKVMGKTAEAIVRNDVTDTWAMPVKVLGEVLGAFKAESVVVVENGPVRAIVRSKSRYGDSMLTQDFILYKDSDAIDGRFRVHWRDRRKMLKLCFTAEMQSPIVTAAAPYGSAVRPNDGQEVPGGEWLDLSEGEVGAAILTDSMFAHDVKGPTAGLTLLRSCIFAHHPPVCAPAADETQDWEHQEQGVREGAWKLIFHDGDWKKAQIPRHAAAFNNRVITIDEANHTGSRPGEDSFIRTEAATSLVTVVKKAEDDDGLVMRMYEYAGCGDEVKIAITPVDKEVRITVGKYEIKTVKLEHGPHGRTVETDLLERS